MGLKTIEIEYVNKFNQLNYPVKNQLTGQAALV